MRSALVDGYVMFCTPENDERLEAVRARGLPYVLVDFSPYVDGPRVNIDDRGGARAVAQHLVDLGHRRFGLVVPYEDGATDAATATEISDPTRTDDRTRWRCFIRYERLLGWRDPIVAAGIDWASVPVGSSPESDAETGYRAAAPLLDRADRPTAIICLSDVLALGVMRAAQERGIRVPQDLSVVGYDDIAAADRREAHHRPPAARRQGRGGRPPAHRRRRRRRASDQPRGPRLQRTRPELNTPERSPRHARLVVTARIARDLSRAAVRRTPRAAAPRAPSRRSPRPALPSAAAPCASCAARRPPRARPALRPAVLSAPSAM